MCGIKINGYTKRITNLRPKLIETKTNKMNQKYK